MVSNVRTRDLRRKLVRGHKITLQEWVNKADKNICRYLVLDDIVYYKQLSSTPTTHNPKYERYEIFNCNTYGFFDKIEDAEKKYEEAISQYANISLITFKDAFQSYFGETSDFDLISVKEMFTCSEFKVDFFMIEPTTMMLLSGNITAFDNTEYGVNIYFNFAKSNDVCVAHDYIIIDITDADGNLVVKHSAECDVDRIKANPKEAKGKYFINAILVKDYHKYAHYNQQCETSNDFIGKYRIDPVYLCQHIITQATPMIINEYNKAIYKKGE